MAKPKHPGDGGQKPLPGQPHGSGREESRASHRLLKDLRARYSRSFVRGVRHQGPTPEDPRLLALRAALEALPAQMRLRAAEAELRLAQLREKGGSDSADRKNPAAPDPLPAVPAGAATASNKDSPGPFTLEILHGDRYGIHGQPLEYDNGDKYPRKVAPGSATAQALFSLAEGEELSWTPRLRKLSQALESATRGRLAVSRVPGRATGLSARLVIPPEVAKVERRARRGRGPTSRSQTSPG